MKKTEMIKGSALRFVDPNCTAEVQFADKDEKKVPQLVMTAYSGGIIPDHWYWGNLAIDLEGLKIPPGKVPILEDHDTGRKIAFATKWSKEGNKLMVEAATFVDTPESLSFRELSDQGFPYEASIFARPSKIQRLMEDEVATVNGFEMKGPGSIWRVTTLKEASICTFGYDPNTKSAAMADDGEESISVETESNETLNKEENKGMKKEQFKKEHEDEYNAIVQEVTTSVTAELENGFAVVKTDLETKLAESVEANTKLTEENTASEKRLYKLELADQARHTADIASSADAIFASKFKESTLPEVLNAKIRRLVSHEKFVVEGALDEEKFGASIDVELADWATDESVQGLSTFRSAADDAPADDSDAIVTRMRGHLGQADKA